jgi:hypothetical protein
MPFSERSSSCLMSWLASFFKFLHYCIYWKTSTCHEFFLPKKLFSNFQMHLFLLQWKRSFFDATQRRDPLGRTNYELWYGLFQSAVLGWKPYLNIDIAHKAFPMPTPVLRLLQCDPTRYDPRDGENLRSELNGLNFIYTPPDAPTGLRMYRFYGIGEPAERSMFEHDGRRLSVAQYFQNKGCPLKYPRLPCLRTAGNAALPIEFCSIAPGQVIIHFFFFLYKVRLIL